MSFKFNALTGGFNTFTQADLTSIGGSNDLSFNDDAKLKLGNGNDLEIYHNGSHSLIADFSGQGNIYLISDEVTIKNAGSTEHMARFISDAAVELYYDNSKKFQTTTNGVYVWGDIDAGDDNKILLGAGDDLQIYHDGTNSFIKDTAGSSFSITATESIAIKTNNTEFAIACNKNGGVELYHDNSQKLNTDANGVQVTGRLGTTANISAGTYLYAGGQVYSDELITATQNNSSILQLKSRNASGTEQTLLKGTNGGAVELYYDGSKKFETQNSGVTLLGDMYGGDNIVLRLGSGTGGDLQFYHNGTNSVIENKAGGLYIKNDGVIEFQKQSSSETKAKFINDADVELYYNGSKKLETTSTGISVTGNVTASTHVYLPDNGKFMSGDAQDLQMYHDGTHSYLRDTGNGNLVVRTAQGTYSAVVLQAGEENSVICNKNAAVELMYDNVKKFETTSAGTTVTGQQVFTNTGVASSYIGANSDGGVFGSDTAGLTFKTGVTGGGSVASTGTVRMQIHNSQFTSFGTDDTIIFDHSNSGANYSGVVLDGNGAIQIARHNDQCLLLNRMGTDGTVESFYNDGTYVGGIGVGSGTTTYATSSDYRLKENVVTLSNAITRLKTLKPYRFNFIGKSLTMDGFFAHEVTAVPEAIVGEKDAEQMQGLDYSKLTPLLTAALQEAITKIETLETKVAALEAA